MDEPLGGDAFDDALASPAGLIGGTAPSLAARLDEWVADARIESSIDARARERWLQTAADSDAHFAGVLLDLAERRTTLAITTSGGRQLRGQVEVLGADFVGLRPSNGPDRLLPLRAVTSVRTAPSEPAATGDRVATTDLRLGDVLGELAAERPHVLLVLGDGADSVAGVLRAVGQDVVTVRVDAAGSTAAYVRLDAVSEVVVG